MVTPQPGVKLSSTFSDNGNELTSMASCAAAGAAGRVAISRQQNASIASLTAGDAMNLLNESLFASLPHAPGSCTGISVSGATTTPSGHTSRLGVLPPAVFARFSSFGVQTDGALRTARAPTLRYRAIKAQIKQGLHPSPDESKRAAHLTHWVFQAVPARPRSQLPLPIEHTRTVPSESDP